MRIVLKKSGNIINEFRFDRGPVYIGRHAHSQVQLPDLAVSREHAVLFTTKDGNWILEDRNSANKTYLNGQPVQKVEVKSGDCIRISDFTIEIDLETKAPDKTHLEDTFIPAGPKPSQDKILQPGDIIIRNPNAEHGPDIRLHAERIKDFLDATEAICSSNGSAELLNTLLDILIQQLDASHAWCSLRQQPQGEMTAHAGRDRNGNAIEPIETNVHFKITEAIDKGEFILMQRLPQPQTTQDIRLQSALIAPLIDPTGCFGVLYAAGTARETVYTLSDLDYLMLIAIHTAAILENF